MLINSDFLVGKTIIEVNDQYKSQGHEIELVFSDKTKASIFLDHSGCYYEGDRPNLAVKRYPLQVEIDMQIKQIQKWFDEHPKQKNRYFHIKFGHIYIDRIFINRDSVREQVNKLAEIY